MSQLLRVKRIDFEKEMDTRFQKTQEISSLDVFDCFVRTLADNTNVLKEEDLKALVFKQFKSYSDFDKTMTEVAQNVSDIQQSTEDAINAIDNNDSGSLKNAYSQLKLYQKRILELEADIYKDDLTGVYNRKYLQNHELGENGAFKTDGSVMQIVISNFLDINKKHGHEAGDVVLKFVSNMLQKRLKALGIHLIRYMGVQFIALSQKELSAKAEKVFVEVEELIRSKTFKTHEGEILHIELEFTQKSFKKAQSFQEIYATM